MAVIARHTEWLRHQLACVATQLDDTQDWIEDEEDCTKRIHLIRFFSDLRLLRSVIESRLLIVADDPPNGLAPLLERVQAQLTGQVEQFWVKY